MKKIGLAILLALLTFMVTFIVPSRKPDMIQALYIFGDSLSDVRNVFQASAGLYPPDPPYVQGRYSNGRVWVEYLAEHLSLSPEQTHNYAYGGATTGNDSTSFVPGMLSQVQTFTQLHRTVPADGLYVLWAGSNDYLQGVSDPTQPVQQIIQSITLLADRGAKRFLIANVPDLGQLPATRTSSNASILSTLTKAHNQGLRRSLKLLNQHDSTLHLVMLDVYSLYHEALINPSNFGFTNVTTACVMTTTICKNPTAYLFWDDIHPTTTTHEILGEKAFTAVENTLFSQTRQQTVHTDTTGDTLSLISKDDV